MKRLYERSELQFALVWIAIYCVVESVAFSINDAVGVRYAANALFGVVMAVILLGFLRRNSLTERYGLCRSPWPARRFLFYIPLAVLVSSNLWNGVDLTLSAAELAFYICMMACIGLLEEVIFRGLLFRAIARDSLTQAIVISSLTFGIGHIINSINGSGMSLTETLLQITAAIFFGFMFVIIFHRGGSLLPCIAAHALFNISAAFINYAGYTTAKQAIIVVIQIAIMCGYTLYLLKALPRPAED